MVGAWAAQGVFFAKFYLERHLIVMKKGKAREKGKPHIVWCMHD
jgi:hypothetical protein